MSFAKKAPIVYVIAGPNGAGKTTFADEFLPGFVDCREFLNADLIAAGLSPYAPESQNFRAGRLLLERFNELVRKSRDFAFETTLSGLGHVQHLRAIKKNGYQIILFFLWLPNSDLAVARVDNRVRQGGHNVPEPVIRRRYIKGIRNLFQIYQPEADVWWLYDASRIPPLLIAKEEYGKLIVHNEQLFQHIKYQAEGNTNS